MNHFLNDQGVFHILIHSSDDSGIYKGPDGFGKTVSWVEISVISHTSFQVVKCVEVKD